MKANGNINGPLLLFLKNVWWIFIKYCYFFYKKNYKFSYQCGKIFEKIVSIKLFMEYVGDCPES